MATVSRDTAFLFHGMGQVFIMGLITVLIRLLPFLFLGEKEASPFLKYLEKVLPYAIIGMLLVYCLRDISLLAYPHGLPELLGCIGVVLLHRWKKNALLSIGGGTILYMILVQTVF